MHPHAPLLFLLHHTASILATEISHTSNNPSSSGLNIGYDPNLVASQAQNLSTHSWEYGTASQALLELYNPELTVFSPSAFPNDQIPIVNPFDILALSYASKHIRLNNDTLIDGDGATGDPASLGVSALLLGLRDSEYLNAARRQYIALSTAPRWENGAISHREESVELWADFIFMAPPFMAYNAVEQNSTETMRQAVEQCGLYRDVLRTESGAWRHIRTSPPGAEREDLGLWSTGNGWAAMGMARVLGTVLHWQSTKREVEIQRELLEWTGEILRAAVKVPRDERGLLRNYWDDESWFGEVSGSALVTATVYRVAVLQEEMRGDFGEEEVERVVTSKMLEWADQTRESVAACVGQNGIASPAVNPLGWGDRKPYTKGSPEGQSFVVIMYAAWRDCHEAGVCHDRD